MDNLNKILNLLLCFAVMFVLTGCLKKNDTNKDLLTVVKERGKLIVGAKYDTKPFGYMDKEQKLKGYDIDLCREIAKRILGDENAIEFKQVTSSNRIFAITSGTVDFAAATMTITPKRQRIIDFSTPYFIAGQAIMVPNDSDIKDFVDLSDKRIIVVLGSTSEMNIKKLLPDADVLGFRTYTDAFSALRTNRADALTTDDTIIYGFLSEDPNYKILEDRLTKEPYGLGFKKGPQSESFRERVNKVIEDMTNDGTLRKIHEKWIGTIIEESNNP